MLKYNVNLKSAAKRDFQISRLIFNWLTVDYN
jgi:hypothetical protein